MDLFSSEDQMFMRRALELAARGRGAVAPNPLVGCVIVKDGQIIAEGWHQRYGEAHAERNAVNQLSAPDRLVGSTVYVTLEPCSHHGKTPPCADLLVQHRVGRVIISNRDPNPLVNGRGIARLQEAGIQVATGLLEDEGKTLNEAFFQAMEA
ncbi:MAG: bifunctional diaminohydroxyphosphoribosylaminopyrimidine deaminase/5-amino-6-(5-phosphoribosylamino)uracil reductase RibD [Tunicatimonas sp.]